MPTLYQFARQLRTHQTECERLIWQNCVPGKYWI